MSWLPRWRFGTASADFPPSGAQFRLDPRPGSRQRSTDCPANHVVAIRGPPNPVVAGVVEELVGRFQVARPAANDGGRQLPRRQIDPSARHTGVASSGHCLPGVAAVAQATTVHQQTHPAHATAEDVENHQSRSDSGCTWHGSNRPNAAQIIVVTSITFHWPGSSANLVRRAKERGGKSASYRPLTAQAESQLATKTENQG